MFSSKQDQWIDEWDCTDVPDRTKDEYLSSKRSQLKDAWDSDDTPDQFDKILSVPNILSLLPSPPSSPKNIWYTDQNGISKKVSASDRNFSKELYDRVYMDAGSGFTKQSRFGDDNVSQKSHDAKEPEPKKKETEIKPSDTFELALFVAGLVRNRAVSYTHLTLPTILLV